MFSQEYWLGIHSLHTFFISYIVSLGLAVSCHITFPFRYLSLTFLLSLEAEEPTSKWDTGVRNSTQIIGSKLVAFMVWSMIQSDYTPRLFSCLLLQWLWSSINFSFTDVFGYLIVIQREICITTRYHWNKTSHVYSNNYVLTTNKRLSPWERLSIYWRRANSSFFIGSVEL